VGEIGRQISAEKAAVKTALVAPPTWLLNHDRRESTPDRIQSGNEATALDLESNLIAFLVIKGSPSHTPRRPTGRNHVNGNDPTHGRRELRREQRWIVDSEWQDGRRSLTLPGEHPHAVGPLHFLIPFGWGVDLGIGCEILHFLHPTLWRTCP
jgi:hypothetical protein